MMTGHNQTLCWQSPLCVPLVTYEYSQPKIDKKNRNIQPGLEIQYSYKEEECNREFMAMKQPDTVNPAFSNLSFPRVL